MAATDYWWCIIKMSLHLLGTLVHISQVLDRDPTVAAISLWSEGRHVRRAHGHDGQDRIEGGVGREKKRHIGRRRRKGR